LGDEGGEAQMALEIPRRAVFPSAGALGRERASRFARLREALAAIKRVV